MSANDYAIYPLIPERWDDFTALFGAHGAVGGCWCMYWRREGAWKSGNGDANREKMHALVNGGVTTGLLAYAGGEAVGWVSVAPRGDYSALARSRVLAPVDEQPVWSIVCFFIRRGWRGQGVMRALLRAAVAHAAAHGAKIVEAYPMDKEGKVDDLSGYMGVLKPFLDEGFEVVARRSAGHPVVRKEVK